MSVAETAFFFESEGVRLFATTHRSESRSADTGIVFCHPYGEEKQFSYPVFVRFARRLAEAGLPIFRFDHRGHGDSADDMGDATVEGQIRETLAAVALARERLGVERAVLFGLRLGATVAALAAEGDREIAGLVLWAPIVVGKAYLGQLLRKRIIAGMLDGGEGVTGDGVLREIAETGGVEIEGNLLSKRMYDELSVIDLRSDLRRFSGPVFVSPFETKDPDTPSGEELLAAYRALGAECSVDAGENRAFWDQDSMYRIYFPEELFARTQSWIQDRWG